MLGESVAIGVIGGLAGVGLGFAGAAIITTIAPKLSATVRHAPDGGQALAHARSRRLPELGPNATHTVAVPMHAR